MLETPLRAALDAAGIPRHERGRLAGYALNGWQAGETYLLYRDVSGHRLTAKAARHLLPIRAALEAAGYRVGTAGDGRRVEALVVREGMGCDG